MRVYADGTLMCAVCYADVAMPLIVERCGHTASRAPSDRAVLSVTERSLATRMRAAGESVGTTAIVLGVSADALQKFFARIP